MNGLLSARVAVIDDDEHEAMVLLNALGRKGVGAIWCSGQPGEAPPAPLTTLRLVFLDLYLVQAGDFGAVMRSTVKALSEVADLKSGGLGIVLWTKHPKEDQEAFEQSLSEQFKDFRPLFLVAQEKIKYLQKPELLDELIADIEQKLAAAPGMRLLLDWEQFVCLAVCSAGNLLASLAGSDAAILDSAAALVQAAGGAGGSEFETLARFFESMNPIVLDSVGSSNRGEGVKSEHVSALHKRAGERLELTADHRAAINRILMTATVQVGQTCVAQGNLYLRDGWDATGVSFPMPVDEKLIRAELYKLFPYQGDRKDADWQEKMEERKKRVAAVVPGIIPCAVEISPGCDHAQNKTEFARVVGGYLIPDDEHGTLLISPDARSYAKQLPPFQIMDEKGTSKGRYSLVLNARFLVTLTPDQLKKMKPMMRIREGVAIDIQAWFSGHAARPGFVAIV